ncbi:MAG: branched-chain amino acid ABC transporter permease [Rhodopila sp.]|nr:branched-chain amino acid ABC transporter permease [Rhodopila sp.]
MMRGIVSTFRASGSVSQAIQLALVATPLVIALLTSDNALLDSLNQMLIWAALALSWNILGGYARQISVGHVAFYGIGAYTSTLLALNFGISPWLGMLAGGALAALIGALLGSATLRLRGPFFTMATIAFAEVVRILAVNWRSVTRGAEGLAIDSTPNLPGFVFGQARSYVLVTWGLMAVLFAVSKYLDHSKTGLRLRAVRDNEDAARALGIHTFSLRISVLAVSAFFTAICGTFYAQYLLLIDPDSVLGVDASLQMALMAVVGGIGSAIGPVLGTYLLVPFGQVLRAQLGSQLAGLHLVIYGLGLVLVLYKLPNGIWPAIEAALKRRGRASRQRSGLPEEDAR